jgi:phosphoglycerate dehydrogenase-like enzyme
MSSEKSRIRIAILDDYQNVALKMADWSALAARADIEVFNLHIADQEALVERLAPFDIVCVMRERTPLPRDVLQRLPRLKLIASTGPGNASIDNSAAKDLGIAVTGTGYKPTSTIELTWALILASVRFIVRENEALRDGLWQTSIGEELSSKTLGVLGLGNIGGQVAQIGLAFGMSVIAWSQNMTPEIAKRAGAKLVSKDELFRQADNSPPPLTISTSALSFPMPAPEIPASS